MARFERLYLNDILPPDETVILDTQEHILSLFRDDALVEQTILRPLQVELLQVLCDHHPDGCLYEELLAWYYQKDVAKARRRYQQAKQSRASRDQLMRKIWWQVSEIRPILEPFGIAIVSRPDVGYELKSAPRQRTSPKEAFEIIQLDGIIPKSQTLALHKEKHILTLVASKTVIEQLILFPREEQFFHLLSENYPQECTHEQLLAWFYDADADLAHKWYVRAKRDRAELKLLKGGIAARIKRSRPRLKRFGIAIANFTDFGYTLSPLAKSTYNKRGRKVSR